MRIVHPLMLRHVRIAVLMSAMLALAPPARAQTFVYDVPFSDCAQPSAQTREYMNFYTGHYVGVAKAEHLDATLGEIQDKNRLVGIQRKYYWRDLQPGPGQYTFNFDEIAHDIQAAKAANKKLSLFILYKFSTDTDDPPIPAYWETRHSAGYPTFRPLRSHTSTNPGWLAALDNTDVRDAFIRMLRAMRFKFNANTPGSDWDKTVAFIQFTETAPGLDLGSASASYFANLRHIDRQAACIFQHTPIVQNTNFPPGQLDDFTRDFREWGVAMGATDVWLADSSLEDPGMAYTYYDGLTDYTGIAATVAHNNFWLPNRDQEELYIDKTPDNDYATNATMLGLDTVQKRVHTVGEKARQQASAGPVTNYVYNISGHTLGANYMIWRRLWAGEEHYLEVLRRGASGDFPAPSGYNAPLPNLGTICPVRWGNSSRDKPEGGGKSCRYN